jgi:phage repressor protein C with HTH and peptisase S24 domain
MTMTSDIMASTETRRRALAAFLAAQPASQSAFCKAAGVSEAAIRAFLKGETRSLNAATYEKLARAAGVPVAEILGESRDNEATPASRPARSFAAGPPSGAADIPILGLAHAGQDQEMFENAPIDFHAMPPYLARVPGAYGLMVLGESMTPRYSPGMTVYVHPHAPPKAGSGVVIVKRRAADLRSDGFPVLVKEYVRRTPTEIFLREYSPEDRVFAVPAAEVSALHVIAGTRES